MNTEYILRPQISEGQQFALVNTDRKFVDCGGALVDQSRPVVTPLLPLPDKPWRCLCNEEQFLTWLPVDDADDAPFDEAKHGRLLPCDWKVEGDRVLRIHRVVDIGAD